MKTKRTATPNPRLRDSQRTDTSEIASSPKQAHLTETSLETIKEVREMVDTMEDNKYKTVHEMGPKLSTLAATERLRHEGVSSGTSAFSLFVKERLRCDRQPEDDNPFRELNPVFGLVLQGLTALESRGDPAPPTGGQLAGEFLKSKKSSVSSADPAGLLRALEEATDKTNCSATDVLIAGAPILESGSWNDVVDLTSLACSIAKAEDRTALAASVNWIDQKANKLTKGIYADMTEGYTIPAQPSSGWGQYKRWGHVAEYVPPHVKEAMTPFLAKVTAKDMMEKGMATSSILRQVNILLSSDVRLAGLDYEKTPEGQYWLDERKFVEGNKMGFEAMREHHSARVELVKMLAAGAKDRDELDVLGAYVSKLPNEISVKGGSFDRRMTGAFYADVARETQSACDAVAARQADMEH